MQGIADYEFIERLGESHYGQNYLARAPERLGIARDKVVVKVISGPTPDDAFRRATRELKHFARAKSDKLVALYDAGRYDGEFYYAMEHLPLGSLAEPAGEVSRHQALRAVADAADAAHALHENGIAHRDIKPANILLTEDGGRLADLGLSQLLAPGMIFSGLGPIGIEYTDPAILQGAEGSRATDIWSLGASLHFALTGVGVYGQLPVTEPLLLMRAVLAVQPALADDLDGEAAALIRRCVDEDVTLRPASAHEVAVGVAGLI